MRQQLRQLGPGLGRRRRLERLLQPEMVDHQPRSASRRHPDRFAVIKPVDPNDPKVADTIAQWADTEGTVAIRIMMTQGVSTDAADPGIGRVLAAAARHSFPVNLLCWGRLDQVGQMAARHPETRLVIDHLGLQQPFEPPAPAEPGPSCRSCWRWRPTTTSWSRSAAPAR